MLVHELHHGGVRALLEWDPTLFDSMSVPEGVTVNDVVDHIIYKYGDSPVYAPEPSVMKYYIKKWSERRLPLWNRYLAAISIEYNPLENYDRTEYTTVSRDGTVTDVHSGTTTDDHTGTITDRRAADDSSTFVNYNQTEPDTEDKRTHDDTIERTNDLTDITDSNIHGNIGVTTSQQMLTSELDLIPRLDIIEYIADNWHSEFCLSIY